MLLDDNFDFFNDIRDQWNLLNIKHIVTLNDASNIARFMKTQQNSEKITKETSLGRTFDIDKEIKVRQDELLPLKEQTIRDANLTKIGKYNTKMLIEQNKTKDFIEKVNKHKLLYEEITLKRVPKSYAKSDVQKNRDEL